MSEDANTRMLIETCLQLGQRVGKLEAALIVAKGAMEERRNYALGWEWKYGEEWDKEDRIVSDALGGDNT